MIRRFSAAIGILILLAMVAALIWTVHRHREQMRNPPYETDLVSELRSPSF
jgi:cyanate permease